ncbi:uncharacterized protein TRAVEDRAFT_33225 [Trametes versicolor FP-101664 SS1]|uniref:uncharacterized protein n=1 Tax=Trametes versicolor (strain FP-101664) TaxID=717944 RepID=UPI0004621556|nr:uncharacterized protein TRAVEDRAFT_33225 [Trametes versicolor FP-101664 SS1]EIW64440.1 hypothetical protein TRAVEDRAFT_33225 [Trametes versicolor FP-101664 SS1]
MSLALLRHPRLSQSLTATRRLASRPRRYSALSAQAGPRLDPEERDDGAQVAGPSSRQPASTAADTNTTQPPLKGTQKTSDFTRVQSYLASINASGLEPTREDLERCRPLHQPSPHSPQYVETYTTLINNLSRSFTKEQLRKFLAETLGASRHSGKHRKKVEYAESIVEQLWGWPTLKELEKAKRDRTEVSIQAFPVTASDLFLFLGPDGSDLLRLSKDFDVHISLRREPMALQVEGSRGALRDIAERLLILKKSFVEETYDLPFSVAIPQDMVQRISRLASAYLENVPSTPGKVLCSLL